jgi:predicted O-methyltransferase YrrM
MLNQSIRLPIHLPEMQEATQNIGFTMGSDLLTGMLLRTLAASKPDGTLLELGTGSGFGSAWLLDGMNANARLVTVDHGGPQVAVARQYLDHDPRIQFIAADAGACLQDFQRDQRRFDLIFADAPIGKFSMLEETVQLLALGGIYIVDDLNPAPEWDTEHPLKVRQLLDVLDRHPQLQMTRLDWSTGIAIATKRT